MGEHLTATTGDCAAGEMFVFVEKVFILSEDFLSGQMVLGAQESVDVLKTRVLKIFLSE